MAKFLHALSLQFYRGIGPEAQRITDFQDFNFFIGANNAGKSIVLNFLKDRLKQGKNGFNQASLESYRGKHTGEMAFSLGIRGPEFLSKAQKVINYQFYQHLDLLKKRIEIDGHIWVKFEGGALNRMEYADAFDLQDALPYQEWYRFWSSTTDSSGGDLSQHWIPDTMNKFLEIQSISIPDIHLIPAKRVIGPSGDEMKDLSGSGLIDRLAMIQSPDHDTYDHDRGQFSKINHFLENVTDTPGARIEIPHNRSAILVHMNNKVLPLASLGTGIHEVVMIAAFSTIHENCIMCIEEPEIHLHPILQRKLMRYLQENTNNQYFIATHSAAFIDTPGAAIFHVSKEVARFV